MIWLFEFSCGLQLMINVAEFPMARSELFKQGLILLRSIVKESTSPLIKKRAKMGLQQLHFKHRPFIFPYDKLDKEYIRTTHFIAHKVSLPPDAELHAPAPVSPTFATRPLGPAPPRSKARQTIWIILLLITLLFLCWRTLRQSMRGLSLSLLSFGHH
jgi:hypothetical protein